MSYRESRSKSGRNVERVGVPEADREVGAVCSLERMSVVSAGCPVRSTTLDTEQHSHAATTSENGRFNRVRPNLLCFRMIRLTLYDSLCVLALIRFSALSHH